jgi:hypothetical protein
MTSRNAYLALAVVLLSFLVGVVATFYVKNRTLAQEIEAHEQEVADALELLRLSIGCYGGLESGGFITVNYKHIFEGDEKTFRVKSAGEFLDPKDPAQNSPFSFTFEAPWHTIDHVDVKGKDIRIFCSDCTIKYRSRDGKDETKIGSELSPKPAGEYRVCDEETAVNAATAMNVIGGIRFDTNLSSSAQRDDGDKPIVQQENVSVRPKNVERVPNGENLQSLWDHNGSSVRLLVSGEQRQFVYSTPRPGLVDAGASAGMSVFKGTEDGDLYKGTAYIFNKRCGPQPYVVEGREAADKRSVTMRGKAPRLNAACQVTSYREDVLLFSLSGH